MKTKGQQERIFCVCPSWPQSGPLILATWGEDISNTIAYGVDDLCEAIDREVGSCQVLESHQTPSCFFVIDWAYLDFSGEYRFGSHRVPNDKELQFFAREGFLFDTKSGRTIEERNDTSDD